MSTDPLIGKTLGDYSIVDILGHGGMARVYRGFDKKLNRYAAVKVIDAHLIASQDQDEYRQRFQNEARAIARLNHPNIVGVYQFDQVGTIYYMAMSFIDGRDLRSILRDYTKKNTYMPYPDVLRIIRDIGSALDYAHREGVIHRDIKPSNIMVTPEGRAVLTDFGLALSVPEGTVGNTFGSAHYIAPEQAVSSAQSVPQSDQYSLGVVLFEMLTNRVPFNDQNAMSVALKHLNDPPPPPSRFNPNISPRVDQVVIKTLNKAPNKRFDNGIAMAQALEFAFSIVGNDDTNKVMDKPPVAGLPSWKAPEASSTNSHASEESASKRANLEIADALEPSRSKLLDDSPTVTDSKKSEAARRALMQAQQKRRQRNRVLGGIIVISVAALLAIVLLFNSSNQAVMNQTATSTARAEVAVTNTLPQGVAVFPSRMPSVTEASTQEVTADSTTEPTTTPTGTIASTAPTDTPLAAVAVFPTVVSDATSTISAGDSAEKQVLLRYDGNTFVLFNRSGQTIDVSGLTFTQAKTEGKDLVFESRLWAGGSRPTSSLPASDCFETIKDTTAQGIPVPPDYCGKRHAWARVSYMRWFWLGSDATTTFAVLRGDTVLATCPVSDGSAMECAVDVHRGP